MVLADAPADGDEAVAPLDPGCDPLPANSEVATRAIQGVRMQPPVQFRAGLTIARCGPLCDSGRAHERILYLFTERCSQVA